MREINYRKEGCKGYCSQWSPTDKSRCDKLGVRVTNRERKRPKTRVREQNRPRKEQQPAKEMQKKRKGEKPRQSKTAKQTKTEQHKS